MTDETDFTVNTPPAPLGVGSAVVDSPVGAGTVTGFSARGFPQVNNVAVAWLRLADGRVFDPFDRLTRPPAPACAWADVQMGAKL